MSEESSRRRFNAAGEWLTARGTVQQPKPLVRRSHGCYCFVGVNVNATGEVCEAYRSREIQIGGRGSEGRDEVDVGYHWYWYCYWDIISSYGKHGSLSISHAKPQDSALAGSLASSATAD